MTAAGRFRAVPDSYAYQDGTPIPGKDWCGTAVTDASGVATFTLPAGYFAAVHWVGPTVVRNTASPAQFPAPFVLSYSTSQVKVQVGESRTTGVLLLNTQVEGLEASPAGITVLLKVRGV
ncbi:hypothetical protein [Kineosporia babensis]|uniref:Uncharacterized protein n=1 Tax=Kineosporia babensis TaxID=499548 RepID=A0A9X1NBU1_9ACTN|nr:hypothetical protein [Kineosporia babensis]MCD5310800.1 hypothetical protein [Kineosporia babensis]